MLTRTGSSLPHRLIKWAMGLLVLASFVGLLFTQGRALILFFNHARSAVEFPYTLNYGEGPLLDQTMRLVRGESIYSADLSQPPYAITNYPPLYILLQTPFASANGAAYWYGRIISLVASGVAALMLGLIVHAVTRDPLASIAAGLSLLTVPYIFYWSAIARIDALALALSLTGLWLILRFHQRWWLIVLAVLFLTAAAYTRQTYALAAPMAAFVWLLAKRQPYRAVVFALGFGTLVLAIFVVVLVATRGGFFTHLITANANALDMTILEFYASEVVTYLPIFLCGAAIFLIFGVFFGRPGWWLALPYALSAVVTALTIAKIGSDVNYLWEFSAALCLLAGLLIAMARRVPPLRAIFIAGLAFQIVMATDLSESKYNRLLIERIEKTNQVEPLIAFLQGEDPVIIGDEYMGELVMSGRSIQFQPFEFSQLSRDGIWDQAPFLEALSRGDYPVVMIYQPFRNPSLRFERWTPEILQILNNQFRPDFQSGETTVYRYIGGS